MENTEGKGKRRGRRKKNEDKEVIEIRDQGKFMIDVTKELENKELILNALKQVNEKNFGKEILLKEMLLLLLPKLQPKDIERLQENSLSDKEKIQRAHLEYNRKNDCNLTYDEFLIRRLGIS